MTVHVEAVRFLSRTQNMHRTISYALRPRRRVNEFTLLSLAHISSEESIAERRAKKRNVWKAKKADSNVWGPPRLLLFPFIRRENAHGYYNRLAQTIIPISGQEEKHEGDQA